jgi:hypothetical protein
MGRRNSGVLFVSAIVATTLLASSCTEYVQIAPDKYDELDARPKHGYRLTTIDRRVYSVTSLVVADSSLVVELKPVRGDSIAETLAVEYRDVDRLERIDVNVLMPLLAAATCVGVLVWALHLFASGFPSGN